MILCPENVTIQENMGGAGDRFDNHISPTGSYTGGHHMISSIQPPHIYSSKWSPLTRSSFLRPSDLVLNFARYRGYLSDHSPQSTEVWEPTNQNLSPLPNLTASAPWLSFWWSKSGPRCGQVTQASQSAMHTPSHSGCGGGGGSGQKIRTYEISF